MADDCGSRMVDWGFDCRVVICRLCRFVRPSTIAGSNQQSSNTISNPPFVQSPTVESTTATVDACCECSRAPRAASQQLEAAIATTCYGTASGLRSCSVTRGGNFMLTGTTGRIQLIGPVLGAMLMIGCAGKDSSTDDGRAQQPEAGKPEAPAQATVSISGCVEAAPGPRQYVLRHVRFEPRETGDPHIDTTTAGAHGITEGAWVRLRAGKEDLGHTQADGSRFLERSPTTARTPLGRPAPGEPRRRPATRRRRPARSIIRKK